jgi:hypothetical protein
MILTNLEIAVFGYSPSPDTIAAHRYWCERAQRLLAQFQPKRRRQRKPRQPSPDGLKTAAQATAKLGCSAKTLNGHVASGALRYVIIGHGTKRPRKMFTDSDLEAFIQAQTRKDPPCRSIATRARHTGNLISAGEVIDFTAPRKPRPAAKPKK